MGQPTSVISIRMTDAMIEKIDRKVEAGEALNRADYIRNILNKVKA